MTHHLMTRTQAIEACVPSYYTDNACKRGHYAVRLTVDGSCTACRVHYQREQRLMPPSHMP